MTAIARAAAGVSKITYNGITFGDIDDTANATFHTFPPTYRLQARNVYADDNRTIQHVSYTLTVVSGIFDLDTSGNINGQDGIEFLKRKLSQAGKQLLIVGLGFGDKVIDENAVDNPANKRNVDLMWGVKPQSVEFRPIGGTRFWEITWVCEFNISECALSDLKKDWISFVYDVGYSNDFEGFTTRVITGKVVIAGLRKGIRPSVNVDRVRDQLTIAIPPNYKRTTNDWRIGREKNVIEFSVIDEQIDGDAPPVGLTDYAFDVEVSNDGIGFGKFALNMSATGKVQPGGNRALVANWFFVHVLTEVAKFRNVLKKEKGQGIVFPTGISIRHRKGSRETSASATFSMVTCLRDIMARGSIWEPLLGTNNERWRTSMSRLWGNRGSANVRVNDNDDIILDICEPQTGSSGAGTQTSFKKRTIGRDSVDQIQDFSAGQMPSLCADLKPEDSWVDYDIRIMSVQKDNGLWHRIAKVMIDEPISGIRDISNFLTSTEDQLAKNRIIDRSVSDQKGELLDLFERAGGPGQFIILEGKALRLNFRPVFAEIDQIGGQKAREVWRIPQTWVVADFLGCPLFAARWLLVYRLENNLTASSFKTLPKNPIVCSTPDPGTDLDKNLALEKIKKLRTGEQHANKENIQIPEPGGGTPEKKGFGGLF